MDLKNCHPQSVELKKCLKSVKCTNIFECKTPKMWFTLKFFYYLFTSFVLVVTLLQMVFLTENVHK